MLAWPLGLSSVATGEPQAKMQIFKSAVPPPAASTARPHISACLRPARLRSHKNITAASGSSTPASPKFVRNCIGGKDSAASVANSPRAGS